MVTQDAALLHRSVRENIKYGNPNASEEEMLRAADMAEVSGFIRDLKDGSGRCGFDAHVGERGVKLSGGQRQRIAIARVILKDAPILLLDEATSALDAESEAVVQEALDRLMKDRTVLAIAHRLSTVRNADRILVIEDGTLVEHGPHDALIAAAGPYARLIQHQTTGRA